jgi:protein-disulfide isomerase
MRRVLGHPVPVQRNRLLLLAAAAAVAVIVVVVVIVVAGGGDGNSSADTTSETTTSSTAPPNENIFAGIPQHGATLGDPKAPATLVVFEDPQCPYCRDWNLGTLPTVIDDYVRPGRIKIAYRGIPIISANSKKGLRAIYAAGGENKLWNLAEALYRMQGEERSGWITDAVIRAAARVAGANPSAVLARSSSPAVRAALAQAAREAAAAQIPGTPTFVLERPPALPVPVQISALDPASFDAGLDRALR